MGDQPQQLTVVHLGHLLSAAWRQQVKHDGIDQQIILLLGQGGIGSQPARHTPVRSQLHLGQDQKGIAGPRNPQQTVAQAGKVLKLSRELGFDLEGGVLQDPPDPGFGGVADEPFAAGICCCHGMLL